MRERSRKRGGALLIPSSSTPYTSKAPPKRQRRAAPRRSFRACRRSTCSSIAARRALACCWASGLRMSRALPPESSTTRWYATHIRRYGYGYRALGFGQRSSQEKRFGALLGLGSFDGCSVLDAGCGFGDFLAYLHERGVKARYTGFDLCAPMVERCRKRFAERTSARFLVGDALTFEQEVTSEGGASYDYVVASGIFGLGARGTRARIQPTVTRLFEMCS